MENDESDKMLEKVLSKIIEDIYINTEYIVLTGKNLPVLIKGVHQSFSIISNTI